jgi:hypothetical protein
LLAKEPLAVRLATVNPRLPWEEIVFLAERIDGDAASGVRIDDGLALQLARAIIAHGDDVATRAAAPRPPAAAGSPGRE